MIGQSSNDGISVKDDGPSKTAKTARLHLIELRS